MKRDSVNDILKTLNVLEQKVYFNNVFNCVKHNLAHDPIEYAKDTINGMSNADLLEKIGDALEEMQDQFDVRFDAFNNALYAIAEKI